MPWLQLFLDTNPAQLDAVEQALLDAGALSVTLLDAADQPLLEPGPGEHLIGGRAHHPAGVAVGERPSGDGAAVRRHAHQ